MGKSTNLDKPHLGRMPDEFAQIHEFREDFRSKSNRPETLHLGQIQRRDRIQSEIEETDKARRS